jgi:hypothetical protein
MGNHESLYIHITGFLPDYDEDDSLKFEFYIDESYHQQIVRLLGYSSLNAMAEGLMELSQEQIEEISRLTGKTLPGDLRLLIGVEC